MREAPLNRPLLILESETGSGKTEAAILRFVELWRAGLVDGLYFAVPTRAAAKQLHCRVSKAMEKLFPARGPGNGPRQPHLRHAAGGAGDRDAVSGIDADSVPVLSGEHGRIGHGA